ncbi:MAG: hypothetical protein WAO71_00655 [Gallionella sp.]
MKFDLIIVGGGWLGRALLRLSPPVGNIGTTSTRGNPPFPPRDFVPLGQYNPKSQIEHCLR